MKADSAAATTGQGTVPPTTRPAPPSRDKVANEADTHKASAALLQPDLEAAAEPGTGGVGGESARRSPAGAGEPKQIVSALVIGPGGQRELVYTEAPDNEVARCERAFRCLCECLYTMLGALDNQGPPQQPFPQQPLPQRRIGPY